VFVGRDLCLQSQPRRLLSLLLRHEVKADKSTKNTTLLPPRATVPRDPKWTDTRRIVILFLKINVGACVVAAIAWRCLAVRRARVSCPSVIATR
jgi:hypothetical protein